MNYPLTILFFPVRGGPILSVSYIALLNSGRTPMSSLNTFSWGYYQEDASESSDSNSSTSSRRSASGNSNGSNWSSSGSSYGDAEAAPATGVSKTSSKKNKASGSKKTKASKSASKSKSSRSNKSKSKSSSHRHRTRGEEARDAEAKARPGFTLLVDSTTLIPMDTGEDETVSEILLPGDLGGYRVSSSRPSGPSTVVPDADPKVPASASEPAAKSEAPVPFKILLEMGEAGTSDAPHPLELTADSVRESNRGEKVTKFVIKGGRMSRGFAGVIHNEDVPPGTTPTPPPANYNIIVVHDDSAATELGTATVTQADLQTGISMKGKVIVEYHNTETGASIAPKGMGIQFVTKASNRIGAAGTHHPIEIYVVMGEASFEALRTK